MTVRTNSLGETYDDRFVCNWHPVDGSWLNGMEWCGLDCPVQRVRVGHEIMAEMVKQGRLPDPSFRRDDTWDRLDRWAKATA